MSSEISPPTSPLNNDDISPPQSPLDNNNESLPASPLNNDDITPSQSPLNNNTLHLSTSLNNGDISPLNNNISTPASPLNNDDISPPRSPLHSGLRSDPASPLNIEDISPPRSPLNDNPEYLNNRLHSPNSNSNETPRSPISTSFNNDYNSRNIRSPVSFRTPAYSMSGANNNIANTPARFIHFQKKLIFNKFKIY